MPKQTLAAALALSAALTLAACGGSGDEAEQQGGSSSEPAGSSAPPEEGASAPAEAQQPADSEGKDAQAQDASSGADGEPSSSAGEESADTEEDRADDAEASSTEEETASDADPDTQADAEPQPGEAFYNSGTAPSCRSCHDNGIAGAPRRGEPADWADRPDDPEVLVESTLAGKGAMPAYEGQASREELLPAVEYLLSTLEGE